MRSVREQTLSHSRLGPIGWESVWQWIQVRATGDCCRYRSEENGLSSLAETKQKLLLPNAALPSRNPNRLESKLVAPLLASGSMSHANCKQDMSLFVLRSRWP
jgi:hypothetical protein